MRYDVFISYSSLDQKVAEGICAYLEQQKIRCFVAYRDIPAGVPWAKAITEALDNSRMMVVVFSGDFNRSEQVDREIEIASEDRKPILTFRITNDIFKGAKKYYLKNLNWIDAFPDPKRQFGALVQNIEKLLDIKGGMVLQSEQVPKIQEQERLTDAVEQNALGNRYYYGMGVTRNFTLAVYWYRKSAEQNEADAQFNLGLCYDNGKGVTQDFAEAVRWYRKAADQGHASAQLTLGYCYNNGQGVMQDSAEAVRWYRKAAAQDYASAQYCLGLCYDNGRGVMKDLAEAVYWYRKAAAQNHDKAALRLKQLNAQ